jgi:hypothetical protein
MNHVLRFFAVSRIIEAGRTTVSDCSDLTLARIDQREIGRTMAGIIRCLEAGRISEEEAILFARAHWALAALKALHAEGAPS